jgi:hypothetical protein
MYAVGVGDDDTADKVVSVQVDDEESTIQFIDIPGAQVGGDADCCSCKRKCMAASNVSCLARRRFPKFSSLFFLFCMQFSNARRNAV